MNRFANAVILLILAAACYGMWRMPGPDLLASKGGARPVRAEVVSTENSSVTDHGLLRFGTQHMTVRMPDGSLRAAANELRSQAEFDKMFAPGDAALVIVPAEDDGTSPLIARDHWRLGWTAALFGAFCLLLCVFGGWTGVKALFSFIFSCFAVWKLLIPLCLRGWSASGVAFLTVAVLTAVIMYLVAGPTRKGAAAFFGAMLGIIASLGLAQFFGHALHVSGLTMPFAQTLLYSGYSFLDLGDVFVGAIVLASSGAVMDLGMDIAAGVAEVKLHNPQLGFRALFGSGLRMGRAVVGTMTTTLLLAYSGGYLTLLMMFAAEGTSPVDFINSMLVSAEIVKTLVGSFGLVLVAPFTALVSALVFSSGERK